jgi:NAD-dependent SIR2 family protein deacetylase
MAAYTCPDCAYTGEPEDVTAAAIVDGLLITCADCGTTVVKPDAFASASRERHRHGVDQ